MPGADEIDLEARRLVWKALADLYLDTELSPEWRESMAQDLAASPYGVDELRRILMEEVHPVCVGNRMAVAGEWAFLDADLVQERILRRRDAVLRWPGFLMPLRGSIRREAEPLFARVAVIRAARDG